jgi:hypothetical protein
VRVVPLDAADRWAIPLDPATGALVPRNRGRGGIPSLHDADFIGEPIPAEATTLPVSGASRTG